MKINIKRLDDDYHLEATNEEGNIISMDGATEIGGHGLGMRPMQLLIAAIGGCSAIDVILILKKQKQKITSFEVEVDGENEKVADHKIWKNIQLHFKISGEVDEKKVIRAVELSLDKYCSVSKILEPTANITYRVSVNK